MQITIPHLIKHINYFQSDSDSEGDSENEPDFQSAQSHHTITAPHEHRNIVWTKPVLVTGTAGCGKSFTIYSIVNRLLQNDYRVLIAAPTGFLTSVFRSNVPDEVDCESVHASFRFPVQDNIVATINWQLSNYDIIIIDEISMIPDIIFNHILKTLSLLLFCPVVMVCGDAGQQQPFSRETGRIMQLNSPFDDTNFIRTTYHFHLREQHRVEDQEYLSFLNTIRRWVPTQTLLDHIHDGRVISTTDTVTDEDILQAYHVNPENTVIITCTNEAANRVNNVVINAIFKNQQPLAVLQLDCNLPPMPIYLQMRVVIIQNRDKPNGVVNGQFATVHTVQNCSVLLKLTNGKIVGIYPVTIKTDKQSRTCYPFYPAYATTMCKAQGQTLTKVIVWFDIQNIPPGTGYVVMSRVKTRNDIYFLSKLKPCYFTPVTRLSQLL